MAGIGLDICLERVAGIGEVHRDGRGDGGDGGVAGCEAVATAVGEVVCCCVGLVEVGRTRGKRALTARDDQNRPSEAIHHW